MRKYAVSLIFAFLLVTPLTLQSAHAASGTWYPGQGLKQGDYYSYNACFTDWHNCAPLQMSFWVKNETSDGSGWNVEFLAVDGSIIQKGIMTIGKITPDPTSFDPNISDYTAVYRSTVSWLDAFATKDDPKAFNVPAWGRTGSVGGQSVGPVGTEKITVGAGTFDTQVIGWHKGDVDNKIWIDPSLAFPVKAIVYVDVTTGTPPPDYTLELLNTGNSQTEPSFLQVSSTTTAGVNAQCDSPNMEQDSVHQSATTDSGSTIIEYRYSPSNPHNGCPIELRLSFEKNFDASQKYSNVQYDIFTVDDKGVKLSSLAQDTGRPSLFAPVGDDDNTFVLKGTTPLSHVVVAVLGTGSEGSLPDTSLAGVVQIDIKTQESFGAPPVTVVQTNPTPVTNVTSVGNQTGIPLGPPYTAPNNSTSAGNATVPEFPLSSLMVMAIVVGLGILFFRMSPSLSNIKL
ncbi:MAG: hypothetical protein KGI28_09500 [Thaumarchaeota archaeon]|nr:hypothetical protein [Nitrososphaerota archaeon]